MRGARRATTPHLLPSMSCTPCAVQLQRKAVKKIWVWFKYWQMMLWTRVESLRRTLWRNWGWRRWKEHHSLHQHMLHVNWTHTVRKYNRSLLHRLPDEAHVKIRDASWTMKKRLITWVRWKGATGDRCSNARAPPHCQVHRHRGLATLRAADNMRRLAAIRIAAYFRSYRRRVTLEAKATVCCCGVCMDRTPAKLVAAEIRAAAHVSRFVQSSHAHPAAHARRPFRGIHDESAQRAVCQSRRRAQSTRARRDRSTGDGWCPSSCNEWRASS